MCDDYLNPSDKLKAIGFTPDEKYIKDLEKMKKRNKQWTKNSRLKK